MGHLIKLAIPEYGDITLNKNITVGILSDAEERVENVAENEKAIIFANFVLANVFVEPEVTLEEIKNLSDETIETLIFLIAEILGIQKEFEDFPDDLSPQEKLYRAHYQSLRKFLQNIYTNIVLPHFEEIFKDFPGLAEIREQAKEILDTLETDAKPVILLLTQVNLWIPLSETRYVQSNLISHLKDIVNQEHATPNTSEMVEKAFIEYFEENNWERLKQMISSWEDNSHFVDRIPIIFDALDAHIDEKYTLSVPAILPQIEGVASSILGTPANKKTGDKISNILTRLN